MSLKDIAVTLGLDDGTDGKGHSTIAAPVKSNAEPTVQAYPAQPTGFTPAPAAPVTPPQQAYVIPGLMTPELQAKAAQIEAEIYNIPSSYVSFRNTQKVLNGAPADTVIKVLQAQSSAFTPSKIIADLNTHLGLIETRGSELEQMLQQKQARDVDAAKTEIDTRHQNIEKLTQQIAEETAKITTLTTSQQTAEASIAQSRANWATIHTQLQAPLLAAKAALEPLAQAQ